MGTLVSLSISSALVHNVHHDATEIRKAAGHTHSLCEKYKPCVSL